MIPTSFHPLGSGLSLAMDYVRDGLVAGYDGYFNGPGLLHSTDTLIWYDWSGNGNHTLDLLSEGFTGPLDWRSSGLMLKSTYFLRQTVVFPDIWNTLVISQNYTLEVRCRELSPLKGWKLSNYWAQGKTPFEWTTGRGIANCTVGVVIGSRLTNYSAESALTKDSGYSRYENNTLAWSVADGVYTGYVNSLPVGQLNNGNPIVTTNIGSGNNSTASWTRFTLGSRTSTGKTLDNPEILKLYDCNALFQSIRLYNRPLSHEELAFNAATDFRRFGEVG